MPIEAQTKVSFPFLIKFWLPPDIKNSKPPIININRATMPTKPRETFRILISTSVKSAPFKPSGSGRVTAATEDIFREKQATKRTIINKITLFDMVDIDNEN